MKQFANLSIILLLTFTVLGIMIGCKLQEMYTESNSVTLLEVSSDRDTTEIVLPKDSLHRVECKTTYIEVKTK